MKANPLVTALAMAAACLAGTAHAVSLNPKGLGQVLIYPYYTVNKNQDTLVSVVNTSGIGKMVKVLFLEGYNGREVLNFNLYLSPHDVWTARVSQVSDAGGAAVFTRDHSCTYPPAGYSFRASAYAGGSVFPADGGPTDVSRTREGYVELIEMGEIVAGSPLDVATTHVQDGTPNDGTPACTPSAIGNAAGANLSIPNGGLFGSGSIINVGQGTFFGYNADAIEGFSSQILFSGSGLTPSLQQANTATSTAGGAIAYVFTNGKLLTLDYARGVDAVSAVFTANAIYNEYLAVPGIGAATDWVVTFPTKRFHVDGKAYSFTTVIPPFHELFHAPGVSNAKVGISLFDQEEGFTTQPDDFSPPSATAPSSLPYEVNVISFLASSDPNAGKTSGVFGSKLVSNIPPYGGAGWMQLDLASGDGGHALRPAANGDVLHGLPVTGFMVYNVINANAQPGKLANYGGLFSHRAGVSCSSSNPPPAQDPCS
ncbi:hypothetical protein [Dokdonella soli]|uniref:Cell surface protein n=1 Tax=Dokdonella soli TaxID=529810 RepID=A0ABN1II28_9GAMM